MSKRLYQWFIEHQVALEIVQAVANAPYSAMVAAYLLEPDVVAQAQILVEELEKEKKNAPTG